MFKMVPTTNIQCFLFAFLIFILLPFQRASAGELKVALASNFSMVMAEIVEQFGAKNEGSELILISGSSGKLYAQIKHGAPFDVFFSADQDKPDRLIKEGLAMPDSQFTYALGSLVLWSANTASINGSSEILEKHGFNKLALANAKLAPYGLASEQVLKNKGLEVTTRHKWIKAENIAQAYQFVASGNADIGFVAKSQVWNNGRLKFGSVWLIDADLYSPIKQDAVILKSTKNLKLATKLMNFIRSQDVQNKIEQFGYQANYLAPESEGK